MYDVNGCFHVYSQRLLLNCIAVIAEFSINCWYYCCR